MLHDKSKYMFNNDEYRDPRGCLASVAFVLALILTIGFALLISGCKVTKCLPEVEYITRDSIITRFHTDSVRVIERDSVYVEKGGDTIFVTKWKTLYKEHITNKVDTIYQDKTQTVVQTEEVRYVPSYYKWCSWCLWIIIAIVLLRIAWWAFKKFYLHK